LFALLHRLLLLLFALSQKATVAAGGLFQHLQKFSVFANSSDVNVKDGGATMKAPDAPFERLGLLR